MPKRPFGPDKTLYENQHLRLYQRQVDFEDFSKTYYVTDCGLRVAVVVAGPDGIALVRQYRHLIDSVSYEIPGGRSDAGESLEAAARRECQEESGLVCKQLEKLITFHPGLDTIYNPTTIFVCRDFAADPSHQYHADEVEGLVWYPLPRCIDMVRDETICDSLSVVALLAFKMFYTRAD